MVMYDKILKGCVRGWDVLGVVCLQREPQRGVAGLYVRRETKWGVVVVVSFLEPIEAEGVYKILEDLRPSQVRRLLT